MKTLSQLLRSRTEAIVRRYETAIAGELTSPTMPHDELINHLPVYLPRLAAALEAEIEVKRGVEVLGAASESAREHGEQRFDVGFDAPSLVYDYQILHACILDVAEAENVILSYDAHRSLVRRLGAGANDAVAAYQTRRDEERQRLADEHLGFLAHELRNPLSSARLALDLLREGELAGGGKIVDALERGLRNTLDLIDHALLETRLRVPLSARRERVRLLDLLGTAREESLLDAGAKNIAVVAQIAAGLNVDGDPRLLRSIITNLLRNAIKFSHSGTTVTLRAHGDENAHAIVEVEDQCGGLSPESLVRVFEPHAQVGRDRSGFGLGLAIAKQATEAHGGSLQVHSLDGQGCVFRLTLPLAPSR